MFRGAAENGGFANTLRVEQGIRYGALVSEVFRPAESRWGWANRGSVVYEVVMENKGSASNVFGGLVGRHMLTISTLLRNSIDMTRVDGSSNNLTSRPRKINKVLNIKDAEQLDGGSLFFVDLATTVETWLVAQADIRASGIEKANVHAVFSNETILAQYIEDVYSNILLRPVDEFGFKSYQKLLTAGVITRTDLIKFIASSAEAQETRRRLVILGYPGRWFEGLSATELLQDLSITVVED